MYVDESISHQKGKIYKRCLLRESYREKGKVKKRTLGNLTSCSAEEIDAIRLALRYKGRLSELGVLGETVKMEQGLSVGAVWTVYAVSKRLGMDKALGTSRAGKLALWQVLARVIDQGSRLSAVRLARGQAACDVLGLERGFSENDLYKNLSWIEKNQEQIERRLFKTRRGRQKPTLFLYDVTSSYLEGEKNDLGAYGYNRDGKRGKKQIVIGLMCDEEGNPVSIEVFRGNTQDVATFGSQVKKAAERFGCEKVTFVGDRGMIKSAQVEDIKREGFHYISAITKPQIEVLIREGVLQLELFDTDICEVATEQARYVLRRNPQRAEEIANTRQSKKASIQKLLEKKNKYLKEHPRAKVEVAIKEIRERIGKLKIEKWLSVEAIERVLKLVVEEDALSRVSRLDGCYVIKTDLPSRIADKEIVHDRYKDLALVEQAFRTFKTGHLELRPVYVRKENNTRAHALVVMLAYMIERELRRCWVEFDLTVKEGLEELKELCTMKMVVEGEARSQVIPEARERSRGLLKAAGVRLPEVLPLRGCIVATKTKLPSRRRQP